MSHLVIYTRGWADDRPAYEAAEISASLQCRAFLGGKELPNVIAAHVRATSEFTEADLTFGPGIELHPLTEDEWDALGDSPET